MPAPKNAGLAWKADDASGEWLESIGMQYENT